MCSFAENLSNLMLTVNSYWKPALLIEEENGMIWSVPQIVTLLHYVLKCTGSCLHHTESSSRLDRLAKNHRFDNDNGDRFFRAVVKSLVPVELGEFFMVPKLEQFSDKENLKGNEILAAFISFLLEILGCKRDLNDNFPVDEERLTALQKELRFLCALLGDVPLQCVELDDDVPNLLNKIEARLNDVGGFIHSLFFTTDRVSTTPVSELLGSLKVVRDEIVDHCFRFSHLPPYVYTGKVKTVSGSVFNIVDSLHGELDHLIKMKGGVNHSLKYLLGMLSEELEHPESLLVKNGQIEIDLDIEDLKEQLKAMANEALHLFDLFAAGDVHVSYVTLRLPRVILKISRIGRELEQIYEEDITYKSTICSEDDSKSDSLEFDRVPQSVVDDDVLVDFGREETEILDQLVGEPKMKLKVISITGMPGLGKTTLMRKLFNSPFVVYHFDRRAWCVVSHTYQEQNALKYILMSLVPGSFGKGEGITSLGEKIYKSLKGMRYLIVLDDVWSRNVWSDLKSWFPDDSNGSRIVLTSRNKDIVPSGGNNYELSLWSEDRCWKLLEEKVFLRFGTNCPPELRDIGRKITSNCYGLPLTVSAMAGTLMTMDKKRRTWEEVEKSVYTYISRDPNNYMKILELSYKHLPDHVKPCFLYFGAFPEDMEIPVRKLISLWIAEGFIKRDVEKSLENVAEEYLLELINRSLVLVAKARSRNGLKSCVIHDSLRELCLKIAREENFMEVNENCALITNSRRLCVHPSSPPASLPYGIHVGSILWYSSSRSLSFYNMKLLRVLDLMEMRLHMDDDLENIGKLVNLRYLAISTVADRLPLSMSNLVNLIYLLVKCHNKNTSTCFIASILLKMESLRHIHVRPLLLFDKEHYDGYQQNNLDFLSFVCLHEKKHEEILRNSPHLRKLKCRIQPGFVKHGSSGEMLLDLSFLTKLESLNMEFEAFLRSAFLKIELPSSITMLTLSKIRWPWEKMSMIGKLPNLVVLKLESDAFVGDQWEVSDDEFHKLQYLKLQELKFTQWNASDNHFPCLKRLVLRKCGILQGIPSGLGDVPSLQLIEIERCNDSVAISAEGIKKAQETAGNEDLKVVINKQQLKARGILNSSEK